MAARLYQDENRKSALKKKQEEMASIEKWKEDQKKIKEQQKVQVEFDRVNERKMAENRKMFEEAKQKIKREKMERLIDSLDNL
ncbi:hypothetical protein [Cetobacterium sp.]|uniref:hypothetical protein n=1 Tax=Cetobacterium sp. TaxID=2071632 RepID=UPI003F2C8531